MSELEGKPVENINNQDISAAQIVEELGSIYSNYIAACKEQTRAEGASRLFSDWLGGTSSIEPLHQNFLSTVETTLLQLAEALAQLNDEYESNAYAAKALELVMVSAPSVQKTKTEWYLMVATYYSDVILPYLAWDDLKHIRDEFVKSLPKHMMFPKEKELCQKMDKLLELSE